MAESSRLKAKGERRKAESKKLKAERVKKKLNPQPLNPQPHPQPSTLNPQPSNLYHSTLNSQPSTLNHSTLPRFSLPYQFSLSIRGKVSSKIEKIIIHPEITIITVPTKKADLVFRVSFFCFAIRILQPLWVNNIHIIEFDDDRGYVERGY
jgi:hypothetical protein